jgi:SAM-dependent methyltransferase
MEAALRLFPPRPGDRVLDIGCGFGDTTQRIAGLVGASGAVLGVDAAPRFIEIARREAEQADLANVRFAVADVETTSFGERFELAFSRMGTMFFANTVAAMRNVREALIPGGTLVMVAWRSKVENDWVYRAQTITERFVTKPEEYEEPTCGPGPFAMANAETTSGILVSAGYQAISLRRCDLPITIGTHLDEAVKLVMSLGPCCTSLRDWSLCKVLPVPVADGSVHALPHKLPAARTMPPNSMWFARRGGPRRPTRSPIRCGRAGRGVASEGSLRTMRPFPVLGGVSRVARPNRRRGRATLGSRPRRA